MSERERTDVAAAVEYLRGALPLADQLTLTEDDLTNIALHACETRKTVPWGETIPEDIFRAYVLCPRVNNEDVECYQPVLWEELRKRVAGKGMREAALEINYWCAERVSYRPTDDRTLNALAVLRRGFGRCGEESTLLVSALRAACIPARQIYVPRWSHCDDNHAWAEAWLGGDWHYMGACEPEPYADSGWFTAAASRAMLVHTRAFGVAPANERIEAVEGTAYRINRTAAYAETALLRVTVTEKGRPCPKARVWFEVANAGEFSPLIEKVTDAAGRAELLTGRGSIRVRAWAHGRTAAMMVDTARETDCTLALEEGPETAETFTQKPPAETRIQPADHPPEVLKRHRERLRDCERIRTAYAGAANGNAGAIRAFWALPQFSGTDKAALLGTLREKDLADATTEMLMDALSGALPCKGQYPEAIWREGVLCPRVADEKLYPVRARIAAWFGADGPRTPEALWEALCARVAQAPAGEPLLMPDAARVLAGGRCPAGQFDTLFVVCARSLGFAARLDPMTKVPEIWRDGAYHALRPEERPDAALTLVSLADRPLRYGEDFTVGAWRNGECRTLGLAGTVLAEPLTLPVRHGAYRVTVCTRQIDGTVDGRLIPVTVGAGETARVEIQPEPERVAELLLFAALPPLTARTEDGQAVCLPGTGADALIALISPGQEPTEHLLHELSAAGGALAGLRVDLLVQPSDPLGNGLLSAVLRALPGARLLLVPDATALMAWRKAMRAGDLRLPFLTAVDAKGRGLFSFTDYRVGSVRSMLRILQSAKGE